jgi:hypothetical protein
MPLPFRFGTGDAIDETGNRSGQLDIVLEFPFLPSFPGYSTGPRVYMAESIAAVIEVKSNIEKEWKETLQTAEKLESLKKNLNYELGAQKGFPMDRIPFFAVGYEGWKTVGTVRSKLADVPIDGILVIDGGVFVGSTDITGFGEIAVSGPESLFWLIWCLQRTTRVLNSASDVPMPIGYVPKLQVM